MDTFIILCFIAVFAALVEFACINFIDTFIKRKKKKEDEDKEKELEKKKLFKQDHVEIDSPTSVIEESIVENSVKNGNSSTSQVTFGKSIWVKNNFKTIKSVTLKIHFMHVQIFKIVQMIIALISHILHVRCVSK